jgi:hypothetical protein
MTTGWVERGGTMGVDERSCRERECYDLSADGA